MRMDIFFLKKFQWCSDKISDTFGIGNFQVAKLLLGVYCGLLIWDSSISFTFLKLINEDSTRELISQFAPLLVLFLWWKTVIDAAEKKSQETPEGYFNPTVFHFVIFRVLKTLFLLIGIPGFIVTIIILADRSWPLPIHYYALHNLCDYFEKILSFIILYFASCQSKPTRTSKLKALIEKLTLVRRPAFSN